MAWTADWTAYSGNPIIQHGGVGTWDANWVHPNYVIDRGDGTIYMYYGGSPSGGSSGPPNKIGLATSTDGLSWSKYGANPIISPGMAGQWDDYRVGHLVVLKTGSIWQGWYMGRRSANLQDIGYLTSSDGITWSRYGGNPVLTKGGAGSWDSAFINPTKILKIEGIYYLYYWGGTSATVQTTWKHGLATSSDGINWTKSPSNPIFAGAGAAAWDAGVLDQDVFILDEIYQMYYQGNLSDGTYSAIGKATSNDGLSWSRADGNPKGRGSGWDSKWNEGPFVIRIGTRQYMYYMGYNGSTFGIGVFIGPNVGRKYGPAAQMMM